MSREIKFRAWDTVDPDETRMITWEYLEQHRMYNIEHPNGFVYMQYTGFKDKNGVEIYHSDVVQYLDGEYSFSAVVEWGDFGWYLRGIEPNDNFSFEDTAPNVLEVIGDIHSTPELLESQS